MNPKLCATLCIRAAGCVGFSQKMAGDGNEGSCKLFNMASLTPTKHAGGTCGKLATAQVTTVPTPATVRG